jgi:hypothetical protein
MLRRRIVHIVASLVISSFALSCEQNQIARPDNNSPTFYGYWIPDSIHWESTNSGNPDMDTVQRFASFKFLHFGSKGQFEIWATTMAYPRVKYDSIIFEFEPGVDISSGAWSQTDGEIKVKYKWIYSEFADPDKKPIDDTIHFTPNQNDTTMIFQHKAYRKTVLFDKASLKKMNAYRNEAGIP